MTASAPLLCIPAPTRAGAGRQGRQLSPAGSHFHHSRSFQADQLPDCIPCHPPPIPSLQQQLIAAQTSVTGGWGRWETTTDGSPSTQAWAHRNL